MRPLALLKSVAILRHMNSNPAANETAETTTGPKVWDRLSLFTRINESDAFMTKALLALYDRQTGDEKATKDTKYDNGIGFNAADAKLLSYCADFARKNNTNVTGEWAVKVRLALPKYRVQLVAIANENEARRYAAKQALAAELPEGVGWRYRGWVTLPYHDTARPGYPLEGV